MSRVYPRLDVLDDSYTGACVEESTATGNSRPYVPSATLPPIRFPSWPVWMIRAMVAINAAENCAASSSIDADALKSCYHGAEEKTLLDAASKAWNKAAPGRSFV